MDKKQEYLKYLKDQMQYYDTKSITEKRRYYTLAIIAICANAVVPIISTFSSIPAPYKQLVAGFSAVAAICNGISLILNSDKNWKHYRDSFTYLEAELRAYNSVAGEYKDLDEEAAFQKLYTRSEAILHEEHEGWKVAQAKGGK